MTRKAETPIEMAVVAALKERRERLALEHKARCATDPQWRLHYTKEAEIYQAVEDYELGKAWDLAALLLDAEDAK